MHRKLQLNLRIPAPNPTYVALLAAIVLAGLGLVANGDAILDFLPSEISEHLKSQIRSGALILRFLLFVDAILLFVIARALRQNVSGSATWESMWAPKLSPDEPIITNNFRTVTALCIVSAVVLRFIGLNSSLWMDEVFTLVESVRPGFGEIFAIYSGDNQHTLYSLLAKVSIEIFGEHAWSLRLPAMLFGVASIWATAQLARVTFGSREALVAAIICTIAYHHIWFSQNARGYTILLFVALLSTDFLLRGLASGRWRYWIGYAVLISLGAYAHLTGVFIALAHALVVAAVLVRAGVRSRQWMRPTIGFLLSGWLTLHYYALTIPQIVGFFGKSESAPLDVNWKSPVWLVAEALGQVGVELSTWWPVLAIGLLAAVSVAAYFLRRDWIFSLAAFLPAVVTIAILLSMDRNLWPRMFFFQIGFIVMFLAAALVAVSDFVGEKIARRKMSVSRTVLAIPVLLLCSACAYMLPGLYKHPKQDYESAMDYVRQHAAPGDNVLGLHMAGRVYELYYAPDWPRVDTVDEISRYQSESGNTWILYTLPGFLRQAKPGLVSELESNFDIVASFPGSLNDGEIVVIRSKARSMENQ